MLKITPFREDAKSLKVHLCGQFTKEYVPELERAIADESAPRVALDLTNVTFVDRDAMVFLCSANSKNIIIENCPSYVTRWIQQERLCGDWRNKQQSEPSK